MKKLYVASEVQAALLKSILIPEMSDGFWKNHRPTDHAKQWNGVEIIVTDTNKLGAENFKIPRLYNFVNPLFIKPNEAVLVEAAQAIKPSSNFRSVKKELIELSRIIGGRLLDKEETPLKANRGNNKKDDSANPIVSKTNSVKRTAVRKTDANTTVTKTNNGATVRRVPVVHAFPEINT